MFELTINNHKVGVFKTLREARMYEPTWIDALEAGVGENGSYIRIIKKLLTHRVNSPQSFNKPTGSNQNESV